MSSVTVKTGLGSRTVASGLDAAAGDFASIPVVDLSLENDEVVAAIKDACTRVGFFYIKNHGVPERVIDAGFAQAKRFFDLPQEEKMKIDIHKSANMKGFTKLRGENVDPANRGDMHEGFDIGPEQDTWSSAKSGTEGTPAEANQWPAGLDDFKEPVQEYFNEVRALGIRLFPFFAQSLGLDKDFFTPHLKNPSAIMRLLYYPAQGGEVDERSLGIGQHTDYECITLLMQDEVEALQVLNKDNKWIHATPKPYHFVVNIADTFQQWTNDYFISTVHRAINRSGVSRYSIPLFMGVDSDTLVSCLPSCVSEDRPARYEPITAGEYLERRLNETYAHSKPAEVEASA